MAEVVTFIVFLLPISECRDGLLLTSVLKVNLLKAISLIIAGSIFPIPFVLLFMHHILGFICRFLATYPFVERPEKCTKNKPAGLRRGGFWGLLFFVGIPLLGIDGRTSALVASLVEMGFKRAMLTISFGALLVTFIMAIVSYGLLDILSH